MSEERAEYLGEVPEDHTYQIRDEAPHDYFSQIPNLVDELNLTPHAYRLYGHLRRVAGETGKCWQSTKTLAAACNMSAGKISEAKQELENTYPPLIRVASKKKENGIYHEITITDIWGINHGFFTGEVVHIVKTPASRSQYEHPRSQCETKKNPIKNNPDDDFSKPEEPDKKRTDAPKRGDLVDGYLDMINAPGMKSAVRVDNILSYLAVSFSINTETKRWREFAKFADNYKQTYGGGIEQFVAWVKRQKGFDITFWTPQRMQEMYPQAFVKQTDEEEPQYPKYVDPRAGLTFVTNPYRKNADDK